MCSPLSVLRHIRRSGNLRTTDNGRRMTSYFKIFVTTPAPTVRPPSRIANRSCSSMAIGVISSIVILVLSPGITISTPPRQPDRPRPARRPEEELRPVSLEKRRMAAPPFLRENVNPGPELGVRRDRPRLPG